MFLVTFFRTFGCWRSPSYPWWRGVRRQRRSHPIVVRHEFLNINLWFLGTLLCMWSEDFDTRNWYHINIDIDFTSIHLLVYLCAKLISCLFGRWLSRYSIWCISLGFGKAHDTYILQIVFFILFLEYLQPYQFSWFVLKGLIDFIWVPLSLYTM